VADALRYLTGSRTKKKGMALTCKLHDGYTPPVTLGAFLSQKLAGTHAMRTRLMAPRSFRGQLKLAFHRTVFDSSRAAPHPTAPPD
jgi:hypothetical protein